MSTLLTVGTSCDYRQDMNEPLGSDSIAPTDGEIDQNITRRLIRSIHGVQPVLIGVDASGWTEGTPNQPCPHCVDGQKVEQHRYAICLSCTRASKQLDAAIKRAMTEQTELMAFWAKFRNIAIKQRALMQRMRRKGLIDKPGRGNHGARPPGLRDVE